MTVPFAFGFKVASRLPSALSRAMRLRPVPPMVVNPPPMRIFPSGWRAMAKTELLGSGLKSASGVPSILSRAMRFRVMFPIAVKFPPRSIFPSA